MINAIIEGISNKLFEQFGYENHMEEIKQDLKEPCFFISCINPTSRRYLGKRYKRTNQFVIQYFPKSKNRTNAECYDVAEKLNWCLEVISVDNKPLRGSRMKHEIVDGVLHFFVNYDCFIQHVEQHETMGNMKSHTGVKG